MNDKTEQALTDALIDQIESAARASFRRHQSSIKGQLLTAADNYDWHLLHAAYQAGIHAMRAQLAEAQRDEAYKHLFESAISVLAAIDRELGLPDDGCNATELTIAEIQRLKKLAAMTDTKAGELLSRIEEWASS